MAKKRVFRQLSGASKYRKWKEWEVGDWIICKLIDQGTDQYRKPSYTVEVEDRDFADQDAHDEFKSGTRMTLNSVGVLDKVIASGKVEIGDSIRIEYAGTDIMKKGPNKGEEAHSLLISVAEEDEEVSDAEMPSRRGYDSLSDDDDL